MKTTIFLIAAFLFAACYSGNAQTGKKDGDTTRIRIGSKKIIIIDNDKGEDSTSDTVMESIIINNDTIITDTIKECRKHKKCDKNSFEGHWHGFEFGLNNYVNKDQKLLNDDNSFALNQSKSWSFSLNLLQYSLPIVKDHFGLVTGLGFEWSNYSFNNDVSLVANLDTVEFSAGEADYKKNKLRTTFLTAPLMLEYQTRASDDDKKFFIGAGLLCGLRLGSSTKQEWGSGNTEYNRTTYDDFSINTFRYGLTARIGYGNWGLFANYSMTPLFKSDKAFCDLYPLTIGIKVINF